MQQDLNPSCDYKHCRSFFQIKYQEMKWNKLSLPFLPTLFNLEEDVVYIKINGETRRKTFKLLDQYIFYKNKNDKHVWLNFENAIIELISDQTFGQGIRLTKCFDSLEFYCSQSKWYKLMKRYAIQYDFHQYYILQKKSGKIKFGEQFKGKNKSDNLEYIIKVFQKSLLFDEQDREQFLKEISVTRHLQTDLTIKFYDLFESSDQIFVVIENLSTNNLDEYREKNPFFSEEKAARVIFRIIKIIAYLHSKSIMHRDVKLENFIFRQSDNLDSLCLTDFKLAEFYDQEGQYQFRRCGTVGHVAPEILNDLNYDLKVDVYSVGIILYTLLTGREPFEGSYNDKIILNALGIVEFGNLKLSGIAMDFLKGVLRVDPLERFSAHEALNHRWFQKEKLIYALKFQIKTTLQKPIQPLRINHSFKTVKPLLLRENFASSFQASQGQRLKSLPEAPLTERVSLPSIQRRITNILPLHHVIYGKVK